VRFGLVQSGFCDVALSAVRVVLVARPHRSLQIQWTRFAPAIQLRDVLTVPTTLPDEPVLLQQMLRAALAEIERQRLIIAALQRRHRFGRRSEKLGEEAVQLGTEDLEQSVAEQAAVLEAAMSRATSPEQGEAAHAPRTEPAKGNRGALPTSPPQVEQVIDIEDKTCPCCRGPLHLIGEDTTSMLDYVPINVVVRVIRRPRYGCRSCEEAIVQAPAPERPITGGMATEALLAHVVVSKYCDHQPLNRKCCAQHLRLNVA
jgi:transposase